MIITEECRTVVLCLGSKYQMYFYRWHTSKWGSCSRTCGKGYKYRRVVCLKHHQSSKKHVPDRRCIDVRPEGKAPCNLGDCPEWLTGPWSHVRTTLSLINLKKKTKMIIVWTRLLFASKTSVANLLNKACH